VACSRHCAPSKSHSQYCLRNVARCRRLVADGFFRAWLVAGIACPAWLADGISRPSSPVHSIARTAWLVPGVSFPALLDRRGFFAASLVPGIDHPAGLVRGIARPAWHAHCIVAICIASPASPAVHSIARAAWLLPGGLFPAACSQQLVPAGSFRAACSRRHVPGGLFPAACSRRLVPASSFPAAFSRCGSLPAFLAQHGLLTVFRVHQVPFTVLLAQPGLFPAACSRWLVPGGLFPAACSRRLVSGGLFPVACSRRLDPGGFFPVWLVAGIPCPAWLTQSISRLSSPVHSIARAAWLVPGGLFPAARSRRLFPGVARCRHSLPSMACSVPITVAFIGVPLK